MGRSLRWYAACAISTVLSACGGSSGENQSTVGLKDPDSSSVVTKAAPDAGALQLLGKHVFFDKISNPSNQACVSCHEPAMGWTGKVPAVSKGGVAIPGANRHAVGGRKPPSSAYGSFSPPFSDVCLQGIGPLCVGGAFWDGRAEGRGQAGPLIGGAMQSVGPEVFAGLDASVGTTLSVFLGPLADQALGPFGNDVEQNVLAHPNDPPGLDGATSVCEHVRSARYAELYSRAYAGAPIDCTGLTLVSASSEWLWLFPRGSIPAR
jgi:cytochrome c peroxidase